MPELHKLTPPLAVLQGKGFKVALVTDGRMSGASGKVPAAIHVSPEALAGGPLAKVRDGDLIRLDAVAGTLDALVDRSRLGGARACHASTRSRPRPMATASGRELFAGMRRNVTSAEEGAMHLAVNRNRDHDEHARTRRPRPGDPGHRASSASRTRCRWRRPWSTAACACSR